MFESVALVLQGAIISEDSAYSVMANAARSDTYEEALFVAPFVTVQGARMLTGIAQEAEAKQVHWIVGLDGVITTPDALQAIADSIFTSSLRGWSQALNQPSLHAKVYMFFHPSPPKLALYVGSANATGGGLLENVEAGVSWICDQRAALRLRRELGLWFEKLMSSPSCRLLNTAERHNYAAEYRGLKRPAERIGRVGRVVIGAERRTVPMVKPYGKYTWIEIAVRGGSSNQIEICKDMAPFFTGGRQAERVDFDLVDGSTNIVYSNNAYRFRIGNFGHRIEVNTDLARTLNFRAASKRRDIVLLRKTESPTQYIIKLRTKKAQSTWDLIKDGERQGRIHQTISGPSSRKYYV
jgi:hypothetical protein